MTNEIKAPFEYFSDTDGKGLEAGYIYIGVAGLNPEANPIAVYFDSNMTVPAYQPIRTLGGFPVNGESISRLYFGENDYSITVKDKQGRFIYASSGRHGSVLSVTAEGTEDTRTLPQWMADLSALPIQDLIPDGNFRNWPAGASVKGRERVEFVNTGAFMVRTNFSEGCTAYKIETGTKGGIRLQRDNTGNGTDDLHYTIPFVERDVDKFKGGDITVQMRARKSATYTGGDIVLKIVYSEEPTQPIRHYDGMFTNGNVVLATKDITLVDAYPDNNAMSAVLTATLPETAVQAAIIVDVSFAGTAGEDDYVDIEVLNAGAFDREFTPRERTQAELNVLTEKNYQSSYPLGLAPASAPMSGGSHAATAVSESPQYAAAIPVRFRPGFPVAPTAYIYAENGQDMELQSALEGDSINALAYKLSATGITVTNNAVVVAGDTLTCQHVAFLRGL